MQSNPSQRTVHLLFCLMSGSTIKSCNFDDALRYGHVGAVRAFVKMRYAYVYSETANTMAEEGNLLMVRELRDYFSTHCTSKGADRAARYGHLHVVEDLYMHGIYCTSDGLHYVAAHGWMDMLKKLVITQGMRCSTFTAYLAAQNGQLDMVQYLRTLNIHCPPSGADEAAANNHLRVVQDLRAHGIHCSSHGANEASRNGYTDVVNDLAIHGIQPSKRFGDELHHPQSATRIQFIYNYSTGHYVVI